MEEGPVLPSLSGKEADVTLGHSTTVARLAAIVGALVLVPACSGAPGSDDVDEAVGASAMSDGGPLSLATAQSGELEAAMDGALSLRDGCLGLDLTESGEFVELVWEADGARWMSDPPTVEYRGTRAAPGDTVTVGGGAVPNIDHLQRPDGCAAADRTFKVDSLSH